MVNSQDELSQNHLHKVTCANLLIIRTPIILHYCLIRQYPALPITAETCMKPTFIKVNTGNIPQTETQVQVTSAVVE